MNGEVIRLPLWRECAKEMIEQGLEYGKVYTSEYFEKWLKCSPDSITFGIGVSKIRRTLEHHGVFLSARGQKGKQYVLLQASANSNVLANWAHQATDCLKRGVILGTNTRLDALNPDDRRRHEAWVERIGTKFRGSARRGASQ